MPNTLTKAPKTAWSHRRRFNVTAANDVSRYFASASDTADIYVLASVDEEDIHFTYFT